MMKKKRSVLKNEWPFLRADIERVIKELNLREQEFCPLKINEWESVEKNIEKYFLVEQPKRISRSWLWSDLKCEYYAKGFSDDPYLSLNLLVSEKEQVYFIVNETINEKTKYWYYEGTVEKVIEVIGEAVGIDEYYLVSKKYKWLLCVNHHNVLMGTGEMIAKMKSLEIRE